MNINEYNEKRYKLHEQNSKIKDFGITCECGGKMMVDTGILLTSNPPKYSAACDKCRKHQYVVA